MEFTVNGSKGPAERVLMVLPSIFVFPHRHTLRTLVPFVEQTDGAHHARRIQSDEQTRFENIPSYISLVLVTLICLHTTQYILCVTLACA